MLKKKDKKPARSFGHLLKWLIAIPVTFTLFVGLYIQIMDTELFHDPEFTRPLLWILLIFATACFIRVAIRWRGQLLVRDYLRRFDELENLGTFHVAYPRIYNPRQKVPHAVLLLHGYTVSPQEFDHLLAHFREAEIPYYAPQITGFGLSSVNLLYTASAADWARDAISAYDRLSAFAENISVIGHSMGCVLATFLAEHRKVHHLILSGPGFYASPHDAAVTRLLRTPILSHAVQWVIPLLPKPIRRGRLSYADTIDPDAAENSFQYIALPIHSVMQVLRAQTIVDIRKAQFDDLTVLWGKDDQTVDVPRLLRFLEDNKVPFRSHCFERTGHNCFEDYDRDEAVKVVMEVLADLKGMDHAGKRAAEPDRCLPAPEKQSASGGLRP
jgi:esterase/lipase